MAPQKKYDDFELLDTPPPNSWCASSPFVSESNAHVKNMGYTKTCMCWSERASAASLIAGTVTIAICCWHFASVGRDDLVAILLGWQCGLLMQIPEWVEWRNLRLGQRSDITAPAAFWLNVLQPMAIIGSSWYVTKRPPTLALGLSAVYAMAFLADRDQVATAVRRGIAPRGQCSHLNLDDWWSKPRTVLFHAIAIAAFAQLPPRLAWLNILIFEGTFAYALTVKCGTSSVWCWSIFVAGIATWLAWRLGLV